MDAPKARREIAIVSTTGGYLLEIYTASDRATEAIAKEARNFGNIAFTLPGHCGLDVNHCFDVQEVKEYLLSLLD